MSHKGYADKFSIQHTLYFDAIKNNIYILLQGITVGNILVLKIIRFK